MGTGSTRGATLVTGAGGCIGAWIVRQLVAAGQPVVAFDLRADARRLGLLLDERELAQVTWVEGDITDLGVVERALDEHGVGAVIHLAALQAPFCRANPPLGASVNVVGTVNLLEAISHRRDRIPGPFVYASSVAAADDEGGVPSTVYGVYKRACEGAADVYRREQGLASIGLRPHTVYGPGRDQGFTSAPTLAMIAAAAGTPYEIPFTGRVTMQYAPDVAAAFVAAADAAGYDGSGVFDLPGATVSVEEIVAAIAVAAPDGVAGLSAAGAALPFPPEVEPDPDAPFADALATTPLADGVADAVARFTRLLADGRVEPPAAG
ncbi:NAD-dependent epimerase/dehydratase family protein [Conexibacter woesei]|uniref:NAD-dependent epimerase/dehydratase n=1 Tax=Conexibacter woesei (strain DSM 14684 / CCUG 47730 / CIP 108061 / JCM 11494 / NBRC 100937 / ID131577) TaxID=469383 RepID=D3FER9_CONWI|nr:SDR family oxidoreductase [Conexibacter woesei]ADB49743.1 NAD-dependent epimerase/dehydratase [Conexibacter woesei DSM 14684]